MKAKTLVNELLQAAKIGRNEAYTVSVQLSGDANKSIRQEVMQELTGEKIPVAKCGINAIADTAVRIAQGGIGEQAEAQAEAQPEDIENYTIADADGVVYNRVKSLEDVLRKEVKTFAHLEKFLNDLPEGVMLLHRRSKTVSTVYSYNLVFESKGAKHTPTVEDFVAAYSVHSKDGEFAAEQTAALKKIKTAGEAVDFYNSLAEGYYLKNAKGLQVAGEMFVGFNTHVAEQVYGCRTYNVASYYRVVSKA